MNKYYINHLRELEAESMYVIREVAAQFENPVLLFSGGKDSIVMAHLASKAFWPAKLPFVLMHIDTGHNFPETMVFRDQFIEKIGARLVVASVQKSIDDGRVTEEKGVNASRNGLQTVTLLDGIEENQFDAALGGGRRDEEKARAKERFFSPRNKNFEWDFKDQPPELWDQFKTSFEAGTHVRIHPLLQWTEINVWEYLLRENIPLVNLYFDNGEGMRYRSLGCAPCTGMVKSTATTIPEIIAELRKTKTSERSGRAQDQEDRYAMQKLRAKGYM